MNPRAHTHTLPGQDWEAARVKRGGGETYAGKSGEDVNNAQVEILKPQPFAAFAIGVCCPRRGREIKWVHTRNAVQRAFCTLVGPHTTTALGR